MPISKERMARYPGGSINSLEWKYIRATVLFEAGNRCQGTPQFPDCRAQNSRPHPETGSLVVLTIMHMDHNESNNDWGNLNAACQRCHNTYDMPHRKQNAAKTRRKKSLQLDLVDWIEELT